MKRIIAVLFAVFFVGTTLAVAAPAKKSAGKIKNTAIAQATGNLKFKYLGTPISIPKGQTILLGERPNGSIVIRGLNMDQIQVGPGTFSTEGYSIVSYQPDTNIIFLNRGKWLTLRDPQGQTATVQENGAILTTNANVNSNTKEDLRDAAQKDAKQVSDDLNGTSSKFSANASDNVLIVNELPASMVPNVLESIVSEQATRDVENTLSPSAPSQAKEATHG